MNLNNSVGVATSAPADRLLSVIKRRGPQRIADVAAALGVTAEAARQKIVSLAADGLLAPEIERRRVGRRPLTDALPLDELAAKGKAVVRHEGRQILLLHTERGVRRGDEQDPRDERGQVSMVPG